MNITQTIRIARPAADVFEFVTTYRNDPLWRAGVIDMKQSDPLCVTGTTTREVMAVLGSENVTEAVVTEVVPGHKLVWKSTSGKYKVHGYRIVEPDSAGARLTYSLTANLEGAMKLAAPVLLLMFQRQIRSDLARLKRMLEVQAIAA